MRLDISTRLPYTMFSSINPEVLMSVSYLVGQKKRVRLTVDLEVFEDFDARQIDFEKLFKLEPAEKVNVYVEDFD
jgi:hypothetical protein